MIAEHPRRAEAETLLLQGQTPAQVAAAVGAGTTTVWRWASSLGLSRERGQRGKDHAPRDLSPVAQEVIAGLFAGDLVSDLANRFQVTGTRIRQIRALISDGERKIIVLR